MSHLEALSSHERRTENENGVGLAPSARVGPAAAEDEPVDAHAESQLR